MHCLPVRSSVRAAALALAGLATTLAAQGPAESLFDGKTLAGWQGDPAVWSVRDGALCGSTVGHPITQNTFLVWQGGELADFELTAEVRLTGDNNSGVQYRSRPVAGQPFALAGYQCDVHPKADYLAMLYEERGGGILATQRQFVARDAGGALRVVGSLGRATPQDLGQWHRLRIAARGNCVWHELDGELVTALRDDAATAARSGLLGLQVHAGAPMTVWFRDLSLRRLPHEEVAVLPPTLAALLAKAPAAVPRGATPQWIWNERAASDQELFLRRRFVLPALPESARLWATADNHCRVSLNGTPLLQSDAWEVPQTADATKLLRAGDNVLAVQCANDGGPAGLVLQLRWQTGSQYGELVSDGTWRCSSDDPDGWERADFDDAKWPRATVLAPLGAPNAVWSAVVGADAFGPTSPPDAPQPAVPAAGLHGPLAAGALQLLAVPRAYGSWVCLCADDRGRLYASDQARGLYRIVPATTVGAETTLEKLDVTLDGCQGLCWFRGALYAVVNARKSGLYRLRDTTGDDRFDEVQLLTEIGGNGEHGPHAVVPAPDGEHLYVICGNHTPLPKLARSRVPQVWAEDRPIAKIEDPNGHAVGIKAPGGYVCRIDPDGKEWELYCCGFRNAYDLAVLPNGDLFTYDSDMEWDMGLPWYRPTRIYQVVSGADYGWRSGTSTWPVDYPEAPPAVADVGPGSPTGMLAHDGAVLALDWTFGTVHLAALAARGGGHTAALGEALTGVPLPVADLERIGDTLYLLTGGRGIPSTLLALPAANVAAASANLAAPAADSEAAAARARRLYFENGHSSPAVPIADCLEGLRADPFVAHAARIALEAHPVAAWRSAVLAWPSATPPRAVLQGLLALARHGTAADAEPVLAALRRLPFAALGHDDRIAWLRVHSLVLQRLAPLPTAVGVELAQQLAALWPTGEAREDAELAELLALLDAPAVLELLVPALATLQPAAPPPWAAVAARNAGYGTSIAAMLQQMPPIGQIALANALRAVPHGWTLAQRRAYFEFLLAARRHKGGASYDGYLKAFVDAAWRTCSAEEQQELADLVGKAKAPLPVRATTPPKGPGRTWTLAEATTLLARAEGAPDLASGRNLFAATGCVRCHYFAGEGGNHGPDLTSLGNKFTARDVLEAVLEPSKVVSDQYAGAVVKRRDGTALHGRVVKRLDKGVEVYEVMPARGDAEPLRLLAVDVVAVEPSPLSPMPSGLVDGLNPGELRDLVAFLLSRGQGLAGR
jgi:putative heme-binding domain-containing protein